MRVAIKATTLSSNVSCRSAASLTITARNMASSGACSVTTGSARKRDKRSGMATGHVAGALRAVNSKAALSSRARLMR